MCVREKQIPPEGSQSSQEKVEELQEASQSESRTFQMSYVSDPDGSIPRNPEKTGGDRRIDKKVEEAERRCFGFTSREHPPLMGASLQAENFSSLRHGSFVNR